jgi:hypothetical protein
LERGSFFRSRCKHRLGQGLAERNAKFWPFLAPPPVHSKDRILEGRSLHDVTEG